MLEKKGWILGLWGDRVDWTEDYIIGQRWQKSHGTISRCDVLGQRRSEGEAVWRESKRMSPEWVKLSWGAWGSSVDISRACCIYSLGAQGRAQLGEGNWSLSEEVIDIGNEGEQQAELPMFLEQEERSWETANELGEGRQKIGRWGLLEAEGRELEGEWVTYPQSRTPWRVWP